MDLSKVFNKEVGKAALMGMGGAAVVAAVLPVIAVTAPVCAVGGAVGALVAASKNLGGPSS